MSVESALLTRSGAPSEGGARRLSVSGPRLEHTAHETKHRR